MEAYEQSYDLFSSALALDKKSADALIGIGKALTAMGRYSEAIQYFDRAQKLSEQNLDARFGIARVYAVPGQKDLGQARPGDHPPHRSVSLRFPPPHGRH